MTSKGKLFTDLFISALKPTGKINDYRESDSKGFGVRVLLNGTKKFFYVYNIEGKRRFLNLGVYKDVRHKSGITLADARKKYIAARKDVLEGKDPFIEKELQKSERKHTPFVADFITEYIEQYAKQKTRGWKETDRVLRKEILPRWGKRKLTDIKKRDLLLLLDEINERGSKVMANRTLAYIRGMFSYAVHRDLLSNNPFMQMERPNQERSRERVLTDTEIVKFWTNLANADMSDNVRNALKLILITGQRPGEVIGIHSSEIEGRWWTIPSERSKNRQAHRVYLTDMALQIIGDKNGYIFESATNPCKPYQVRTMTHCIKMNLPHNDQSNVVDKLQIPHFVPHDLRRTMATNLAKIGVSGDLIDRIQNHISKKNSGVSHVYNRYSYDDEKKNALELWEKKLGLLTKTSVALKNNMIDDVVMSPTSDIAIKQRESIAGKLLSGELLSKSDIKFILKMHKPNSKKRGRPLNYIRDLELAYQYYESLEYFGNETEARKYLKEYFGLSGPENDDQTFRKALNKGKKYMKKAEETGELESF